MENQTWESFKWGGTLGTGDRDRRVVIENRTRHAAEERDPRDMPIAEGFRRLTTIGLHKARVRVRQAHRQEVDLALNPVDDAQQKSTWAWPGGCASGTNISR